MSTGMMWQTNSDSSETTEQLGERLGKALKGGETIELVSDLGGGKTTFTRGIARGARSSDVVASPTFTISKVYQCPKFAIHHFDFYRLQDEPGIVADELAEVLDDPTVVTIIEWAGAVRDILPKDKLVITITQTPEGSRDITCTYPPALQYLVEALQ